MTKKSHQPHGWWLPRWRASKPSKKNAQSENTQNQQKSQAQIKKNMAHQTPKGKEKIVVWLMPEIKAALVARAAEYGMPACRYAEKLIIKVLQELEEKS